jgi:hypothetical protein
MPRLQQRLAKDVVRVGVATEELFLGGDEYDGRDDNSRHNRERKQPKEKLPLFSGA